MADKTVRLTAPNGSAVVVAAGKEQELLRRGFTAEQAKSTTKKASAKKASAKKASSSDSNS